MNFCFFYRMPPILPHASQFASQIMYLFMRGIFEFSLKMGRREAVFRYELQGCNVLCEAIYEAMKKVLTRARAYIFPPSVPFIYIKNIIYIINSCFSLECSYPENGRQDGRHEGGWEARRSRA